MSHIQVLSLRNMGAKRASAFIRDTSASRGHCGWMENLALTDTEKRKKRAAIINLYLKHELQVVLKTFDGL